MSNSAPENAFGRSVTSSDIVDTLGFFDSWQDRYKYIIDLGKEIPPMPASLHTDDRLVRGCQSQVWMDISERDGRFVIAVDSDALIVKGLLGIVLAAYNYQTPEQILAFDIDSYLESLDLLNHLSPTRGNGLRAMVSRVKQHAGGLDADTSGLV